MNLQITGRHFEITDAIRAHVKEKFNRLERHFSNITQTHVILALTKDSHIAEAKLHLSGAELFAESKMENLYAAIDTLIDKLDRQIVKHKEKLQNHHAQASKFNGYNTTSSEDAE